MICNMIAFMLVETSENVNDEMRMCVAIGIHTDEYRLCKNKNKKYNNSIFFLKKLQIPKLWM